MQREFQKRIFTFFILAAGLLFGSLQSNLFATDADGKFSIAIYPDTQMEVFENFPAEHAKVPTTKFRNRSQWLIDNKDKFDLRFVLHTGDMVNWEDDGEQSQYKVASDGFKPLDGVIPYAIALGNHDTHAVGPKGGSARDTAHTRTYVRITKVFHDFFPVTRFPGIVTQTPDKVDNAYQTFEACGTKWLVLTFELWPRKEMIDWAEKVIENHHNHNIIIGTHHYLNGNGAIAQNSDYGERSPQYLFDNLIRKYPNIKLVFSGHTGRIADRTDSGIHGNKIVSTVACIHDNVTNPVQIMEIDVNAGTLTRRFFAPFTDYATGAEWLNDQKTITGMEFIKPGAAKPAPLVATAGQKTIKEWSFNVDGQGWNANNHLKEVVVKDGLFRAKAAGRDPFITLDAIDIPALPSQFVEFRLRTNSTGTAELYYTNTAEGQHGGFDARKIAQWNAIGDEQFHVYRIYPNWSAEQKIVKLRLDFPNLNPENIDGVWYELDWIRLIDLNFAQAAVVKPDWNFTVLKEGWAAPDGSKAEPSSNGWKINGTLESNPISLDVDEHGLWISFELAVDKGKAATVEFLSQHGVLGSVTIPLKADGEFHWYNIDCAAEPTWRDKVHQLRLTLSDVPTATATLKRLMVSDDPQGPANIVIENVFQTEGINRTDTKRPLAIRLKNNGGQPSKGIKIDKLALPEGVSVVSSRGWESIPEIKPLETKTYILELLAKTPVDGKLTLQLAGAGVPNDAVTVPLRFEKNLHLPKADYVPVPKPVESEYEIGAFYYPGWNRMEKWERIYSTHAERKPTLGWYDEGNPEVVDWQIKWSVENGIQYYYVDWYWNKGNQHNDHWVKAFQRARYKSMFKWAMMWANHNPPGSHSEEDQRAVTKFWIENYFNTSEYYTIDGRPVVMIWSPKNMDDDMIAIERNKGNSLKKGEGVKRLLDISQSMAKAAGYKGIFFVTMKFPEASTSASDIQWLADAGFEMTSIYHFMHHGGKAENPKRFPFELVIEASLPFWEARHKTGILPFLPNLSTGWDSQPWHGDKNIIIDGRDVAGFKRICEDYKKFSAKTGIKSFLLAPTNEWGEGSYIEPNAEFGFGMFETIRDTFCKKPAGGWSPNFGPEDVGLGPYDLPPLERIVRTSWDFNDGAQGWSLLMGVAELKAGEGRLSGKSTTHDPAITTPLNKLNAADWSRVVVRMKVQAADNAAKTESPDRAQLFWSTTTGPVSEANSLSVPIKIDGQFHDYVFDVKSVKNWRRLLTSFRFDPLTKANHTFEIESIRLE